MRRPDRERGAMALELALVAPVFIAMLLLVVGFGRVSHARNVVDQAAASAARAASLTDNPGRAAVAGETAAKDALAQAGVSCRTWNARLDTSGFRPGGEVVATVRCTAGLSDLAVAGMPGSKTLTAVSRAPLETYREFGR